MSLWGGGGGGGRGGDGRGRGGPTINMSITTEGSGMPTTRSQIGHSV